MKRKKLGRPALPRRQVRSVVAIRLSREELTIVTAAAERDRKRLSAWVREAALERALSVTRKSG